MYYNSHIVKNNWLKIKKKLLFLHLVYTKIYKINHRNLCGIDSV